MPANNFYIADISKAMPFVIPLQMSMSMNLDCFHSTFTRVLQHGFDNS